jgi:hypothetical protein
MVDTIVLAYRDTLEIRIIVMVVRISMSVWKILFHVATMPIAKIHTDLTSVPVSPDMMEMVISIVPILMNVSLETSTVEPPKYAIIQSGIMNVFVT